MKYIDYPTAESSVLYDADKVKPPKAAKKLLLLTRYGILTIGRFDCDSHIAWGYLPKIPASVKSKMGRV